MAVNTTEDKVLQERYQILRAFELEYTLDAASPIVLDRLTNEELQLLEVDEEVASDISEVFLLSEAQIGACLNFTGGASCEKTNANNLTNYHRLPTIELSTKDLPEVLRKKMLNKSVFSFTLPEWKRHGRTILLRRERLKIWKRIISERLDAEDEEIGMLDEQAIADLHFGHRSGHDV